MKKIITILSTFLIITLLFTGSCYARAGGGSGSGSSGGGGSSSSGGNSYHDHYYGRRGCSNPIEGIVMTVVVVSGIYGLNASQRRRKARLLHQRTKKQLDILGGKIRNYCMQDGIVSLLKLGIQNIIKYEKPANYMGTFMLNKKEKKLYINRITNSFPEYEETDIVLNFFIAKTDVIKNVNRWDNELKLQEHTAFFYKAKENGLRIAFSNKLSVQHKPLRISDYGSYRERDFTQLFLEKYGISEVVSIFDNGSVTVAKNENFERV